MAINKVKFGNQTLIDLTDTTATADKILTGFGAYGKDGVWMDGSLVPGADDGYVYQDQDNYVVLDDDEGVGVGVTPLTVTENGTYNAGTRRAYNPVTVNVPERAPKFTAIWYDDYSGVKEVVCNKTYQEVHNYVMNDGQELGTFVEDNESRTDPTGEMPVYLYVVRVQQGADVMRGIVSGQTPYAQINYYSNGGITVSYDDIDSLETLSVTRNGTYTPGQNRVISEVTVNVQPSLIAKTVTPQRTTQIVTPDVVDESTIISSGCSPLQASSRITSGGSWYTDVALASGQENRFTSFPVTIKLYISFKTDYTMGGGTSYGPGASKVIDTEVTLPNENYEVDIPVSSTVIKKLTLKPYSSVNQKPRIYIYYPDSFSGSGFRMYIRNADVSFPQYGWSSAPYDNAFRIYPAEQYDGLSQVTVNGDADLVASNIKKDVEIFGVTGTYEASGGGSDELGIALLTGNLSSEFIIPSTVSSLGAYALYGRSIVSLYGSTVTQISHGACSEMKKLTYASFPELLSTVGSSHFYNNASLTEFYASKLTSVGSAMFYRNLALSTFDIVNAKQIYEYAFAYCSSLSSIPSTSFPSVGNIYSSRFVGCTNLTTVELPYAKSLYSTAFSGCSRLVNFSAPMVTSLGQSVFFNDTALTNVYMPSLKNIRSGAFHNCQTLSSLVISDIAAVPVNGFRSCWRLSNMTLPSVTVIYSGGFAFCSSLETIEIPNIITLGSYAFSRCSKLKSINISPVGNINTGAFYSCYSLSKVTTGSTLSIVASSAFFACSRLTSFMISGSRGTISPSAFMYCRNLQSLYLFTSTVVTLGNVNAFTITPLTDRTLTGSYGSVFVPESLYVSYTNGAVSPAWQTLGASRFVSLTDAQISAILNS